jgi:two-component system, cell cycle sensor histidine kinase and response regulator CckA
MHAKVPTQALEPNPLPPSSLARLGECLLRYEDEHRAFIDASPDLVARFDPELRFVDVNPAMLKALGRPKQTFLGHRPSELEGFGSAVKHWDERIARAARKGEECRFEFEWRGAPGEPVQTYEARLIPERPRPGEASTVLAVARDVTARRIAEEAARDSQQYYRALIADSSDLLAVLDRDLVVRYCSDSSTRLLGRRPEMVVGTAVMSIIHPEDAPRVAQAHAEGMRSPGDARRVEARVLHADGRWRLFEVMGKTVCLDSGVPTVILNARDVTDQRRLEAIVQRSQRVSALGRMAGGIAHEFNNLLSTILGTCELLSQDLPNHPQLNSSVGLIRDAGRSAASLTQQLLTFGRQETLRPESVKLRGALDGMRPFLTRILGADVALEISGEPGGAVEADRGLFEQIILNLVSTSREGMPAGGRLTITWRAMPEPHGTHAPGTTNSVERWVCITVRDTRTALDADAIDHMLDPFGASRAPGGGSGLGLALVHSIVEQSGGAIEVDSAPAYGVEFRIYLPAAPVEDAPEIAAPVSPPPALGEATGWDTIGGWETILVVEDDEAVLQVTARVLQRLGYRVLSARTPTEALRWSRTDGASIHLVVCDVHLPGMSGPALSDELHARWPGLQVLFVSGYVGEAESDRSVILPPGAAFLQKPYTVIEIGNLLRRLLGSRPGTRTATR